ncbi:MAG TPA: hypothetical protein VF696_01590 [Candidatus Paceibacterota bacterium]|jgi:hypothetical protein
MTLNLRVLVFPVLVLGAFFMPEYSRAQSLPAPIVKMSEAAESAPASRSTTDVGFTVHESGQKTYQGKARGTFVVGAGDDADSEGSFSFTFEQVRGSDLKDVLGKNKFSIGADFKIMPSREQIFFRITQFPSVPDFDIKKLTKKWVYVDVGDYAREYGEKADFSSREVLEHFNDAHRKYPAFMFTEQGSTSKEYVYTFRANPRQLMRMVNEAYRLAGEDQIFSEYEIDDAASHLDTITGTLKINKTSYLPTAATYRIGVTYDEYRTIVTSETKYQYGPLKPVKRPSGAIDIEKWINSIFGDLDEARTKGSDAAIKSQLANSRAEAELFYDSNNSSYRGVCSEDNHSYWGIGDNVEAAGGDCNDTTWAWAASAKLSTGKYYCVDSTGFAKETKKKLGSSITCS